MPNLWVCGDGRILATGLNVCGCEGFPHCSRSQSLIEASEPPDTRLRKLVNEYEEEGGER